MGDVAAADVEQPGDGMGVADQQAVGALQRLADALQLGRRALAGEPLGMGVDRRQRRARTVGPDRVDRVGLDRDQLAAGGAAGLRQPFDRFRRVQPGIVTEPAARAEIRFDPGRRRLADDMLDGERRTVDLRRRLQRVAAVDEQSRLVGQHDRQAGRTREAGQPQQPLGAGRHVFVLVLVGARDDEPGEPARSKLGAQRGDARRPVRRPADLGEALIIGDELRRPHAHGRSASVTTWPMYGSSR